MIVYLVVMAIMAICIFFFFRANWVFNTHVKLLKKNLDQYKKLRGRNYMLQHFWIWDVEKFIKE